MIIINADDWGRSKKETDIALECYRLGRITSVTAMVFMTDSKRSADIARDQRIPTGLHLNFSEVFSEKITNTSLADHQGRIARFLNGARYCQVLYNPFLGRAFEYVFRAQVDEFSRLYDGPPTHFDGHHHMHVCTNMLIACPIARGQKVRRSFSFEAREKGLVNREYRKLVNRRLATRYRLTDYFFALSQQLRVDRFARVCSLASGSTVEVMTHPTVPAEEAFLKGSEFEDRLQGISKGSYIEL